LLWLRDRWLPLSRGALALAGGFLLGSLPAWVFYAARGDAAGQSQRIYLTALDLSTERFAKLWTTVLPTLLGTYYWDPEGLFPAAALGMNVAASLLGLLAVLAAVLRRRAAEPADAAWGRLLLLLILVAPFAILYGSRFVSNFDHETARYIL